MSNEKRISRRSVIKGAAAGAGAAAIVSQGAALAFAQAATPASSPAAASLSGSINISYPDQAGYKPKYVEQAVASVTAANPGVTINVDHETTGDDDYYTKLLLAMDAGNAVDVFHIGGDRIGELAEAGYIQPLDALLGAWPDWAAQYPASVQSSVQYKGKTWAVPYGLDTYFLYYRKDIFKKAGLPEDWKPANQAAVLEAAVAIQKAVPNVIPYALYGGAQSGGGEFNMLTWAFGGEILDKDNKWVGNSDAIRKTLDYYVQAFQTDKASPQVILTEATPWTDMRAKLGSGELAMLFEGGWVYGGWYNKDATGTEANVGYILHSTETGGPSFTQGGPGTCWFINAASKNIDLAFAFIKAFNSTEIVAALNTEDPHPVARTDSAQIPTFKAQKFLVDSTESLKVAKFLPPDPNSGKVDKVQGLVTGLVADGEIGSDEGAKRYTDELKSALGDDHVVVQD